MAKPPDAFHEFVMELFTPMGPVSVRRMFGGAGVFKDGLMFALLSDDVIYLKTDAALRAAFARVQDLDCPVHWSVKEQHAAAPSACLLSKALIGSVEALICLRHLVVSLGEVKRTHLWPTMMFMVSAARSRDHKS